MGARREGDRRSPVRGAAGSREAGAGMAGCGGEGGRRSPVRGADGLDVERERKRNVALEVWGVFTGYSVSE